MTKSSWYAYQTELSVSLGVFGAQCEQDLISQQTDRILFILHGQRRTRRSSGQLTTETSGKMTSSSPSSFYQTLAFTWLLRVFILKQKHFIAIYVYKNEGIRICFINNRY